MLLQALQERNSDIATGVAPLCAALAEVYFIGRYPGFDFDDPDWPALRPQIEQITALLATLKDRVPTT